MTVVIRFLFLFSILGLFSCSDKEKERLKLQNQELMRNLSELNSDLKSLRAAKAKEDFLIENLRNVTAIIQTTAGNMKVEFFPELTPIHVFNFVTRAESGFYNGTYFHRVIEGFMIQGGDPNTKDTDPTNDGLGGPLVKIPHEFNDTKHEPGILSMARVSDKSQGAGSQFFIVHKTYPSLDNEYTAFGKVVEGLDVVNRIATAPNVSVEGQGASRPKNPVRITNIIITN